MDLRSRRPHTVNIYKFISRYTRINTTSPSKGRVRERMMATSSHSRRSVSRDRNILSEDRLNSSLLRIEEGHLFPSKKLIIACTRRVDKQIVQNAITTLTTHAEHNGLTSQQIGRLIDVLVLPDGLDRGSVSKILGSLYPSGKVEEDTAVKIIACLGLGSERAPLPTQVYHILER